MAFWEEFLPDEPPPKKKEAPKSASARVIDTGPRKPSVIEKAMKGWVDAQPLEESHTDYLRTSQIKGLCPREFVFHYWNPIPHKSFDATSRLKMDAGTDAHARFQNQFLGPMRILYGNWRPNGLGDCDAKDYRGFWKPGHHYIEDNMWNEEYRISGHLDGWICLNRLEFLKKNAKKLKGMDLVEEMALIPMKLVPWELKTLSKFQFAKMKEPQDIPDYYRSQATTYQWLSDPPDVDETLFTLVERDTMTFKDLVYKGEEMFINEAKRKAKIIWEAIRDETLPDSMMKCSNPKAPAGKGCVYHEPCWQRTFDMKKHIDACRHEQPTRKWLDLSGRTWL